MKIKEYLKGKGVICFYQHIGIKNREKLEMTLQSTALKSGRHMIDNPINNHKEIRCWVRKGSG